jgi:hypothetical protein
VGPGIVCGYKVLRELGSRALPSYAAIDPKPRRPEEALCVIEQLSRDAGESAATAEFLRDAKRLTQLKHPNLVRVRDVVLGASTVLLVTDWVDGEIYSDIARMAAEQGIPIPLAGSLRVVVDLLEGLSALHELCDAKREPLRIVHAEVAPRNVVVGIDGRSVLVHPLHAPAGPVRRHAPDVVGYLAPEVLLGDQTADQRADVYGAGVLLWEALTGQRMHADGEDAGEIVMRLLGGKIEPPCAPADAPWAAPLAEAAKKAVSPDPTVRFANATEMLADVRRVVGARLAPKLTVSALVEAVAGERIRARNESLGAGPTIARLPSGSAWTTDPPALAPTPVAAAAVVLPVDPEATKPPPSAPPPTSSRPRVAPSWGRIRPPSSGSTRAAQSTAPPPATPERASTVPSSAAPPSHEVRFSEPPGSLDVVEVVELEIPPDAPPQPKPPPFPRRDRPPPPLAHSAPPESPVSLRLELTESKTDMGALIGPARAAGGSRTRWTLAFAFALVAGAILWMLMRSSTETRAGADPAVAPSASATTAEAPTAAATAAGTTFHSATPPPGASARATNDPGPFDPAPAEDPRAAGHTAAQAPIDRGSIPVVRPAPPAPQPPTAPASSSTRSKKPVYDPMGI